MKWLSDCDERNREELTLIGTSFVKLHFLLNPLVLCGALAMISKDVRWNSGICVS